MTNGGECLLQPQKVNWRNINWRKMIYYPEKRLFVYERFFWSFATRSALVLLSMPILATIRFQHEWSSLFRPHTNQHIYGLVQQVIILYGHERAYWGSLREALWCSTANGLAASIAWVGSMGLFCARVTTAACMFLLGANLSIKIVTAPIYIHNILIIYRKIE